MSTYTECSVTLAAATSPENKALAKNHLETDGFIQTSPLTWVWHGDFQPCYVKLLNTRVALNAGNLAQVHKRIRIHSVLVEEAVLS